MTLDPEALRRLGGRRRRPRSPAPLLTLVRVGAGAGLAAALCNVVLLLIARGANWDTTVADIPVTPLSIVAVCLIVGALAAVGTYVAARVTKRPEVWTVVAGGVLYVASLPGLPPAVVALHTVTALWVVAWLAVAVRGRSHLR